MKKFAAFFVAAALLIVTTFSVSAQGSLESFIEGKVVNGKVLNTEELYTEAQNSNFNTTKAEVNTIVDNILKTHQNEIFTKAGGFIQTYGTVNEPINKLCLAGTHNSYSNRGDQDGTYIYNKSIGTLNSDISIEDQLSLGIRYVEYDVGNTINGVYAYHRLPECGKTKITTMSNGIKDYLNNNPNEFVILRVCELYSGNVLTGTKGEYKYENNQKDYMNLLQKTLEKLRDDGILDETYNYAGEQGSANLDGLLCPGTGRTYNNTDMQNWPSVREMVNSGKRIIVLFPHVNYNIYETDNSSNEHEFSTSCADGFDPNTATTRGGNALNDTTMTVINETKDHGSSAGWHPCGDVENNGRRTYEYIKAMNAKMYENFGKSNCINVCMTDFFYGDSWKGGRYSEQDIVDAANRFNLERRGCWNTTTVNDSNLYWDNEAFTGETRISATVTDSNGAACDDLSDELVYQNRTYNNTQTFNIKTAAPCNVKKLACAFIAKNGYDHNLPETYTLEAKDSSGEYKTIAENVSINQSIDKAWNIADSVSSDVTTDEYRLTINENDSKDYAITEIALY